MKTNTLHEAGQLLCYLASSARGLLDEPADYGTFRLIDAVSRLIAILETEGAADEELIQIKMLVDEGKYQIMTDMEGYKKMLDEAVIALVTWLDNK